MVFQAGSNGAYAWFNVMWYDVADSWALDIAVDIVAGVMLFFHFMLLFADNTRATKLEVAPKKSR